MVMSGFVWGVRPVKTSSSLNWDFHLRWTTKCSISRKLIRWYIFWAISCDQIRLYYSQRNFMGNSVTSFSPGNRPSSLYRVFHEAHGDSENSATLVWLIDVKDRLAMPHSISQAHENPSMVRLLRILRWARLDWLHLFGKILFRNS